jgi:hypothetical protein
MPDPGSLTERQQKWFASVQEGLQRETGKSLAEWAELAKDCPETAPRKRLAWMKAAHGLGQNRAAMVLNAAFPPDKGWSKPDALAAALWRDPAARIIHDVVRRIALELPDVIVGQRKGYTAFSRKLQFAALKPAKQGALLGLALEPSIGRGLAPSARQGWSERLLSQIALNSPDDFSPEVQNLMNAAWQRS